MRSVFVVDLRHGGRIPREVKNVLELMGWETLRPGVAYVLDWREAPDGAYPFWDRIDALLRTARRAGLGHRFLTIRPAEKIPIRRR